MSWIEFIANRQAFDSLYSIPPSLKEVTVVEIRNRGTSIGVDFIMQQPPDIIPKRGIWATKTRAGGVYVSISFNVEYTDSPKVCELHLPDLYDIEILPNPEYREIILYENNFPYLASSDKIIVQIKNDSSNFSFFAYRGDVMRMLPVNSKNVPERPHRLPKCR